MDVTSLTRLVTWGLLFRAKLRRQRLEVNVVADGTQQFLWEPPQVAMDPIHSDPLMAGSCASMPPRDFCAPGLVTS